ncbi:MAG: VOC family protein [Phycisphaerae bacterium]|nr:VOC family protein [Phycisphaerae bacterium]
MTMERRRPVVDEFVAGICLVRISHVEIRVRDLEDSARFYTELLGLEQVPAEPPSDKVCRCLSAGRPGERFGLVLAEGLPPGTPLAGMDHLALEVPTRGDVWMVYERARSRNIPATEPRFFDGFFQTFVFDPNGHKVEIVTSHDT